MPPDPYAPLVDVEESVEQAMRLPHRKAEDAAAAATSPQLNTQPEAAGPPSSPAPQPDVAPVVGSGTGSASPVPGASPPAGGCGMPGPALHPNGTLFVVCGNGATLHATDDLRFVFRPLCGLHVAR